MMANRLFMGSVGKVLDWARAQSLNYITAGSTCCADEMLQALGCRYDLERLGCQPESDPSQADLLIVSGMVSYKAAQHLRGIFEAMPAPKYVMAIGACASCGGPFSPENSYSTLAGVDRIVPVDIYVPGCPPRPEAIMNGLLQLQGKIRGLSESPAFPH